jgi:hypothetical protein
LALRGGHRDFTCGGETNSVLAGQVTWFRDTANNRTIIQMDDADADRRTVTACTSLCAPARIQMCDTAHLARR